MTRGFKKKILLKLCYQYMTICMNLSPTSSLLHPLQVGNCDSNSRLVVDEDDNGKLRPERVNRGFIQIVYTNPFKPDFIIVIFIHYKPRIAVAILYL